MLTAGIWLGTRRKSAHANTAQMPLSMSSSRYCSTFAPLFFLIFWVVVVFWEISTFYFYFFDIFTSLRSTKEVTIKNMSLNKWKACRVENSEDVLKIDKKLVTTKRGFCDQFLVKIKFSDPVRRVAISAAVALSFCNRPSLLPHCVREVVGNLVVLVPSSESSPSANSGRSALVLCFVPMTCGPGWLLGPSCERL